MSPGLEASLLLRTSYRPLEPTTSRRLRLEDYWHLQVKARQATNCKDRLLHGLIVCQAVWPHLESGAAAPGKWPGKDDSKRDTKYEHVWFFLQFDHSSSFQFPIIHVVYYTGQQTTVRQNDNNTLCFTVYTSMPAIYLLITQSFTKSQNGGVWSQVRLQPAPRPHCPQAVHKENK